MGAMVMLVGWVVSVALVMALMQSQSNSDALNGVIRVMGLRTMLAASQSALAEASFMIRHPSEGGPAFTEKIEQENAEDGEADDPAATREAFQTAIERGVLSIEPVRFHVVTRGDKDHPEKPWLIDLTVRTTYRVGSVKLTRQVRRRMLGHELIVRETLGPDRGKVVLAALSLNRAPLFEVIEP